MRNKRFLLLILSALMIIGLNSCQLAVEDGSPEKGADRLIGFFVTREYLDLFDHDLFIKENIGEFVKDGEVALSESANYQGRLYASLAEDGETGKYVFEDLDGIAFYSPTYDMENFSHIDIVQGEEICDAKWNCGSETKLEATIYVVASEDSGSGSQSDGNRSVYYFNHVYQSADGSVYLTTGPGLSGNMTDGVAMSQWMEEKYTETVNGETTEYSVEVRINVEGKNAPKEIIIAQMDGENREISRQQFAPEAVPESLKLLPETEYLIVETRGTDSEGGIFANREIIRKDEPGFSTFYARDDGICAAKWVEILRP